MSHLQAGILVVEVGIIALSSLLGILTGYYRGPRS